MNRVQLIGNLGRAVELRELGGGKVVGKTILAVSRMRKGERSGTDWIPLTLWDRQAQSAARYLGRGSRVAVEGRLHGDFVPVKGGGEGEGKRSQLRLEVVVDRITYLTPPRRGGEAAGAEAAEETSAQADDAPADEGRPSRRARAA
jgi:single-strand DNA-binding protein